MRSWDMNRGFCDSTKRTGLVLAFAMGCLLLAPGYALAYGGGAEIALLPYFFALVAAVGTALFSVLLWPIRALIRRIRGTPPQPNQAGPEPIAQANLSQDTAALTAVAEMAPAHLSEAPGDLSPKT